MRVGWKRSDCKASEMKYLLITLLVLTCATLHAQSVIVYKTDAGNVRGKATEYVFISAVTNLLVTGDLDPSAATGTYYYAGVGGGLGVWTNVNTAEISYSFPPYFGLVYSESVWINYSVEGIPTGTYSVLSGATGTATVAYSIITNTTPATVVIHGIATP